MPLAAYATLQDSLLHMDAVWGDPEGQLPLVRAQAQSIVVDAHAATRLGEQVARQLQAGVQRQTAGLEP